MLQEGSKDAFSGAAALIREIISTASTQLSSAGMSMQLIVRAVRLCGLYCLGRLGLCSR